MPSSWSTQLYKALHFACVQCIGGGRRNGGWRAQVFSDPFVHKHTRVSHCASVAVSGQLSRVHSLLPSSRVLNNNWVMGLGSKHLCQASTASFETGSLTDLAGLMIGQ